MPKVVKITKTAIDDVISTFANLPAKEASDYSLREAIKQILPAINSLLAKGYNHAEISKLLEDKKILISETTLRQYLRDFTKDKAKTSGSKISKDTAKISSKVSESKVPKDTTKTVEPTIDLPSVVASVPSVVVSITPEQVVPETKEVYKSKPKPGSENFK